MSNLTNNEATALLAWVGTDEDFDVLSFATIGRRSRLPQHLILGYVMGSTRVRSYDPEALPRFASKSSENAARSVG